MPFHQWVLDTNVFYTYCCNSNYIEYENDCVSLLHNLLSFCENHICWNEDIKEEYDRVFKRLESTDIGRRFLNWWNQMHDHGKIDMIQPYTPLKTNIHRKDEKFYQTSANTNDKIFVTCEEKHLSQKKTVYEEHKISVLNISEALEEVVNNRANR
ncbi:MAG: hypothetical protein GF311_18885 [Candidatus Lokiarchaeota archaeon]|nr:hypothetical protein [Candidatus Lokiarchaeota archaeon]